MQAYAQSGVSGGGVEVTIKYSVVQVEDSKSNLDLEVITESSPSTLSYELQG